MTTGGSLKELRARYAMFMKQQTIKISFIFPLSPFRHAISQNQFALTSTGKKKVVEQQSVPRYLIFILRPENRKMYPPHTHLPPRLDIVLFFLICHSLTYTHVRALL